MASAPPNTTTFPLFSLLPTELRLKIWRSARPSPRVHHLHWNPRIQHLVTAHATPSLLSINHESRSETLRTLKSFFEPKWDRETAARRAFPYVYVDPEADTFYFPTLHIRPLPAAPAQTPIPAQAHIPGLPGQGIVPFVPVSLPPTPNTTSHILRVSACDLDNLQFENTALYHVRHLAFSHLMWTHFFAPGVLTHVFLLEFRGLESITVVVDCGFQLSRKELGFYEVLEGGGGDGRGVFSLEKDGRGREERERVFRRVGIRGRVMMELGVGAVQMRGTLEGYRDGMKAKVDGLRVRDPSWKVPRIEVKVLMRGDWV